MKKSLVNSTPKKVSDAQEIVEKSSVNSTSKNVSTAQESLEVALVNSTSKDLSIAQKDLETVSIDFTLKDISIAQESLEVASVISNSNSVPFAQESLDKEIYKIHDEIKKEFEISSTRNYPTVQVTVQCKLLGITSDEFNVIDPSLDCNLQDHKENSTCKEKNNLLIQEKTNRKSIVKWIVATVVGLIVLNKYFISASDDTGNCLAIAAY